LVSSNKADFTPSNVFIPDVGLDLNVDKIFYVDLVISVVFQHPQFLELQSGSNSQGMHLLGILQIGLQM